MRFLFLTKKFPYPPIDGESLLVSSLNSTLKKKGHDIDILSFNTTKHFFDPTNFPAIENPYTNIWLMDLDTKIKLADAFFNLFSKQSFHISRFIRRDFEEKLKQILTENFYDYIIFESIYLDPYFGMVKKYSEAKLILRAHNVEYEIWERVAKNTRILPLKIYLNYLASKLKKYELANVNNYDLLIALTERDLGIFKNNELKTKNCVLPAGIDGEKYFPEDLNKEEKLKISFIGSLDWMPNSEGIKWFKEKCWNDPRIKENNFELHIAGRNTPEWIYNYTEPNIKVHGEVPDSRAFINSCPVMIVPLLAGSGMRLKILEALALGRVIITTSIGLEGINAEDGKEILIADDENRFVEKLLYCKNNFDAMKEISAKAMEFFVRNYDLNKITENFLEVIKK